MPRGSDISPLSLLLGRVDAVADGATPADTVPSGFPSLDKLLGGGLRRGDLIVLGGDVGSGKSAFALAIALRVAQASRSALFYSGEMHVERVLERVLAIEGRTRIDDLRRGTLDEASRAGVGAAAVRLRDELPIVERVPVGGIGAIADEVSALRTVELVVIDGLDSLLPGTRNTEEEEAAAIRALKQLALDTRAAVLVTSPLPLLQVRDDRRPVLDDFGARGTVKERADVVLALFREGMYDTARGIEGATELLVRKNRNGGTGYVDLYFYAQWMRFEDMLDPDR
ncbi:MAG TPA: DnaB-like helicase C-terminal domain-containing protein [Gemmatimonadaceae bacterium]|jgi:replicative DNA helicase|nr:DnaB-like helicase C-terminal domain-containing protein [Gemmatimonadaceae bacterium]